MELGVEAQNGAASSPCMISSRQGQMLKVSEFGQGMCQKVNIVAFGRRSRTIAGNSAK